MTASTSFLEPVFKSPNGENTFCEAKGKKYFIGSCAWPKIPKGIIDFYKAEKKCIFQTIV